MILLYVLAFSEKESSNWLLELCLANDYWVIGPRPIILGCIIDIAYYLFEPLSLGFWTSIDLCLHSIVLQVSHLSHMGF